MVAYPLAAFDFAFLLAFGPPSVLLTSRHSMQRRIVFLSRHEILATGCLHVPAIASFLFCREAHRAAFDFDLEEEDLDFVEADFACAPLEDFFVDCFAEVLVVFVCVDIDATCFVLLLREPLPRTRMPGASFTGSATVMARPGAIVLEERRFQRRSSSTDTPKRSATVMSVSPRRTV
jgi:hypothetical protein